MPPKVAAPVVATLTATTLPVVVNDCVASAPRLVALAMVVSPVVLVVRPKPPPVTAPSVTEPAPAFSTSLAASVTPPV